MPLGRQVVPAARSGEARLERLLEPHGLGEVAGNEGRLVQVEERLDQKGVVGGKRRDARASGASP